MLDTLTVKLVTFALALGAFLPLARAEDESPGGLGLFEPSRDQSGVQLQLSEGNLTILNYYHRDIGYFIYRLDAAGEHVETLVANGYLGGVSGATSVVSVLQNVSANLGTASSGGYAHLFDPKGNPLFTGFDPVASDPVALPVKPKDAESTTYRVVIVGPGNGARGPELTADESSHLAFVNFVNALKVVNSILSTASSVSAHLSASQKYGDRTDALMTFYGAVMGSRAALDKGLQDLLTSGKVEDLSTAALTILNAITDQSTVRDKFAELVVAQSKARLGKVAPNPADLAKDFEDVAKKFRSLAKSVAAVDALLGGSDLLIQAKEHAGSNVADQWTVKILPVRVKITPGSLTFAGIPDELPTFTCKATLEVPQGSFLVYEWRTTGKLGNLLDLGEAGSVGTAFGTRSEKVKLVVDGSGQDTISCGVLLRTPGAPDRKLGAAHASVTGLAPVTLTPERAVVLATGDEVTFTAKLAEPTSEKLTFRWSTPGRLGVIDDGAGHGGTEITSDRATVTFRARSPEIGLTDDVTVVVAAGTKEVGKASARVKAGLDVTIAPEPGIVTKNGDRFTLQATLSPVTTEALTYEWTTTGTLGVVSDALTGRSGPLVSTPASSVTFETRTFAEQAIDTVTLRVLRGQAVVGRGSSQVRARGKLLDPEHACVVRDGDSVRFTAAPGGATYRWSCSGVMGTLEWSSTSNVATYVANAVKVGQVDTVTVEIVAPDGSTSRATARVSGLDFSGKIYAGTWTGTVTIVREYKVPAGALPTPVLDVVPVTFTLRTGSNPVYEKTVNLVPTEGTIRPTPGLTTASGESLDLGGGAFDAATFPTNPSAPTNEGTSPTTRTPCCVFIRTYSRDDAQKLLIFAAVGELTLRSDGQAMSASMDPAKLSFARNLGSLTLPSALRSTSSTSASTGDFSVVAFDLRKAP